MLSHDKFKQIKVKTKITNGSPAPVYKGLEAIECLLQGFLFQYATEQNRIGNMPKFSLNECNEKLFKLPNAENLFDS